MTLKPSESRVQQTHSLVKQTAEDEPVQPRGERHTAHFDIDSLLWCMARGNPSHLSSANEYRSPIPQRRTNVLKKKKADRSVRLIFLTSAEQMKSINAEMERTGASLSEVIRRALDHYLEGRQK
jgi:hypothetical protein